ncbi:MAG: hydroxyacylglutathione hydrolase [Proteobacteria bacterium]|nr:MAG: hydroxyacylglutathione hydrolase [Pseudomonadota bacterium]
MRPLNSSVYQYKTLSCTILGLRSDNYTYMLRDEDTGKVLVIDPSETKPVIQWLDDHHWTLDWILDTHHHHDHIEGNVGLKDRFQCKIAAPAYDIDHGRITGKPDLALKDGDVFEFGSYKIRVITTPGHTLGHISLFVEGAHWLFSGDTLFSLGCGRLFEGTPVMLWESFQKLLSLPDSTLVFCGHEYTLANANFIDKTLPALDGFKEFQEELRDRLEREKKTIPSKLSDEKRFNPYFLTADPRLSMFGQSESEVFGKIRQLKDNF